MGNNYVYCSDLKNHQVLGTFLELLYYMKESGVKNIFPLVIVGDRDAECLLHIKKLIQNKLEIENGFYEAASHYLDVGSAKKIASDLLVDVKTLENLQEVVYEGINIGVPVASNLVSRCRCTQPDLKDSMAELKSYVEQSVIFLVAFKSIMETLKPALYDEIYIYNGRHYNTYPQTLVVEGVGGNLRYYERMNSWRSLRIQRPRIHDFAATAELVKKFWVDSIDSDKEIVGRRFFEENRQNIFSNRFKNPFLHEGEYIVYYTSSEDEYASLDSRIKLSNIFESQRKAVEWLVVWAGRQDRYQLIIRNHPNQQYVCAGDYEYWHGLKGKNVGIIPSESRVDSYSLMKGASKTLCWFSTVGIEAAYMGVPSIILGNAVYKGLDAVYEPGSTDELRQILDVSIKPKPSINALPYGYFTCRYGHTLELYKKLGLHSFESYPSLLA